MKVGDLVYLKTRLGFTAELSDRLGSIIREYGGRYYVLFLNGNTHWVHHIHLEPYNESR